MTKKQSNQSLKIAKKKFLVAFKGICFSMTSFKLFYRRFMYGIQIVDLRVIWYVLMMGLMITLHRLKWTMMKKLD